MLTVVSKDTAEHNTKKGLGHFDTEVIMTRSNLALRPPQHVDGPPCPGCGAVLCVSRIEPADKPDCDLLTFECAWCEYKQLVSAKRSGDGSRT
jgi:hypothetical protein